MNITQVLSHQGEYQHTVGFGKPPYPVQWRYIMTVSRGNKVMVSRHRSFDSGRSWECVKKWKGTVAAVGTKVEDGIVAVWVLESGRRHKRPLPARGWHRLRTP